MQAYDYNISHRPEHKHQNADGLSRLPAVHVLLNEAEELYSYLFDHSSVHNNSEIQKNIEKLRVNTFVKEEKLFKTIKDFVKLYFLPSLSKLK